MAADRRDCARIKQRRPCRHSFERIVGMPHPGAQLETPPPALFAPDLVFEIEIGNVGNFLAHAQRCDLTMDPNRYVKRAEVAREVEMLILQKMLIREDEHRVFCESIFDRAVFGGFNLLRQIDVADLGSKTRRDRKNGDSHYLFPPKRYHHRLDHFKPTYAISR